jgi:hypothetical protein
LSAGGFTYNSVQCVEQGKSNTSEGTNDAQVMIRDQLFSEMEYEKKKSLPTGKETKSADETFQFLFVIFNIFEL